MKYVDESKVNENYFFTGFEDEVLDFRKPASTDRVYYTSTRFAKFENPSSDEGEVYVRVATVLPYDVNNLKREVAQRRDYSATMAKIESHFKKQEMAFLKRHNLV